MRIKLLILLYFAVAGVAQAQTSPAFQKGLAYEKDDRQRYYLSPTRVVWMTDPALGLITNSEKLLKQGSGQADLSGNDLCVMRSNKGNKPGILLDFGKEIHGGISLVTDQFRGGKPVRMRIRFGESVSEAMSDVDTVKGATNDHAMRDMIVSLPWLGKLEAGDSGFRFARIDLVDDDVELKLKEVRAILVIRDIPYLGSFNSSDTLLNKIWMTGAYTVHLNMQNYLWDGIKRDRLVWVGDMHPETSTIAAVFGDNEVVQKSLDQARDITPWPQYMAGMVSYSMWWIIIQHDWYMHSGNLAYLKQQKIYLNKLLDQLVQKIDPDNREVLDGSGRFLDWPSSTNPKAIHAGLQGMLIITLLDGAKLSEILGDQATANKCREVAARLKKHVPDVNGSKQAAAMMALAGLMSAEKANAIITTDGVHNYSTFYGYYMLQAKAKANDYQGALNDIRNFWGPMLQLGATTFWEDFNIDWMPGASRIDELVPPGKKDIHADYGAYCYKGLRHSLAHGWASGPTPWLTEHVLGIKVMAPGCKVISVKPHLGDLAFAEGTFPTPLGIVSVKHTKMANGTVKSVIKAPPGIRIIR
ncbi:alpha-L-rhamnosidase [Mucilaginibacter sp. UR6-1]|uniref:alpha-L-rhamnosidase-related protein n=1 Tax=Mucilaginibacter sp. UR6-1 TaxID=1435643 RepID=UPI001E5EFB04|nr:alpha-L-rhamnosidase [Mucilaginibacter sp. UR6-1]MCC8409166.1 alpha-L-rhamnosidase [Mucilaginibacter sp. UR6-1]